MAPAPPPPPLLLAAEGYGELGVAVTVAAPPPWYWFDEGGVRGFGRSELASDSWPRGMWSGIICGEACGDAATRGEWPFMSGDGGLERGLGGSSDWRCGAGGARA